jgi:hypothetical protein
MYRFAALVDADPGNAGEPQLPFLARHQLGEADSGRP